MRCYVPAHSHGQALRLTRFIALLATLTLAVFVAFRSPADYRMLVCVIVSLASISLATLTVFRGKAAWAVPFLGVLCLFTQFQIGRFSPTFISIVDMAGWALFAASPLMLCKATAVVAPLEGSRPPVRTSARWKGDSDVRKEW